MQLTKNFSKEEFDCHCGCEMPDNILENIKKLAKELQIVRDYIDEGLVVNSGYRCLEYNRSKAVGSNDASQHPKGKAGDVRAETYTPDELYNVVKNIKLNPFLSEPLKINGIGRYNTFTHLDIREAPAEWDKRVS